MLWKDGKKMIDNEIKDILFDKLKAIYNNRNFVIGVMSNASHIEDRKKLIEYIDKGEDVTAESIILLSLYLSQKRTN